MPPRPRLKRRIERGRAGQRNMGADLPDHRRLGDFLSDPLRFVHGLTQATNGQWFMEGASILRVHEVEMKLHGYLEEEMNPIFISSALVSSMLRLRRRCPKCRRGQIVSPKEIEGSVRCKFCGSKIHPCQQEYY